MYEEIDIIDDSFELSHSSRGANVMFVPLMEEYPSPENQFDIFFGVNGEGGREGRSGDSGHFQPSGGGTSGTSPTGTTGGGGSIDPATVAGALEGVAGLFSKTEEQKALKTRCGRRPIFKKNRATWDACKEQFYAERGGYGSPRDEDFRYRDAPIDKGMSLGAKIGIGVLIAGVAGTLIYFGVKASKAKAK